MRCINKLLFIFHESAWQPPGRAQRGERGVTQARREVGREKPHGLHVATGHGVTFLQAALLYMMAVMKQSGLQGNGVTVHGYLQVHRVGVQDLVHHELKKVWSSSDRGPAVRSRSTQL